MLKPPAGLQKPYILFLPFLIIYSVIVIVFSKDALTVDEPSYLGFANNLLNGFYSPPPPDIDLWHGPGYPILIAPLVALKLPLLFIRLLNAVMLYFTVILFYKLILKYSSRKFALVISVVFGCYWLAYKGLPVIMTETFVFFLFMLITYVADKYFSDTRIISRQLFLLSFLMAFLALTKFLFGYVIAAGLIISFIYWFFYRTNNYKRAAFIFMTALVLTLPYLVYTYSLTGRIFYWGNSGGTLIYWMSNPVKGEYGNWFNGRLDLNESVDGNVPGAKEKLLANHQKEMSELNRYTGVERDDAFKRRAINNIRQHPLKYMQNWIANIGRLLFNYPYSYRKYGYGLYLNAVPNILLVILIVTYLPFTISFWKRIPAFIKFVLLVAVIYFIFSTFLSAAIRMFYVLSPALAVWLCYVNRAKRRSYN